MPPTSISAPEWRRVRAVSMAAAAAPVLAVAPVLLRDEQYRREELVAYIGGWSLYTWIAIWVAVLDLRRPHSRGWLAFVVGGMASVVAVVLAYGGGLVVGPSLAFISMAASMHSATGWHRGRLVASAVLLSVMSLLYLLVLVSD